MTRAPDDDALPVVRASDLDDGDTLARWLVDTLWARAAVGVLGGAPKCCKSWLALDLAVSVASGTPCLGAFDVDDPGPVLLYMAEDAAPVVKARLSGICRARQLDLASVPIHVITVPVLRLDRGRDQARLRDAVRRHAPRLLVLDPFVRLHRIDENDAGKVSALLGYLRTLQRQHDVAVLVVHHARKNGGGGAQAGQSLRGSGDFHAWGDSNLYVRQQKDALVLTIEHRAAAAPEPLRLQLVAGDDADVHLAIIASDLPVDHEAPRDLDRWCSTRLAAQGVPSAARSSAPSSASATSASAMPSCASSRPGPSSAPATAWPFPFPPLERRRERNDLGVRRPSSTARRASQPAVSSRRSRHADKHPRRASGARPRAASAPLATRRSPAQEPRRHSTTRVRDDLPRGARAGTARVLPGSAPRPR